MKKKIGDCTLKEIRVTFTKVDCKNCQIFKDQKLFKNNGCLLCVQYLGKIDLEKEIEI